MIRHIVEENRSIIECDTIEEFVAVSNHLRGDKDEDGWTVWEGGERAPVPADTRVEYVMRDGDSTNGYPELAGGLRWTHTGFVSDIIKYKVVS